MGRKGKKTSDLTADFTSGTNELLGTLKDTLNTLKEIDGAKAKAKVEVESKDIDELTKDVKEIKEVKVNLNDQIVFKAKDIKTEIDTSKKIIMGMLDDIEAHADKLFSKKKITKYLQAVGTLEGYGIKLPKGTKKLEAELPQHVTNVGSSLFIQRRNNHGIIESVLDPILKGNAYDNAKASLSEFKTLRDSQSKEIVTIIKELSKATTQDEAIQYFNKLQDVINIDPSKLQEVVGVVEQFRSKTILLKEAKEAIIQLARESKKIDNTQSTSGTTDTKKERNKLNQRVRDRLESYGKKYADGISEEDLSAVEADIRGLASQIENLGGNSATALSHLEDFKNTISIIPSSPIEQINSNLEETAKDASEACDEIERMWIRSEKYNKDNGQHTFRRALDQVQDEVTTKDTNGNVIRTDRLVNQDKLGRLILEQDKTILNLEKQIAEEEGDTTGLQNKRDEALRLLHTYEDILDITIQNPRYATNNSQIDILNEQRMAQKRSIMNDWSINDAHLLNQNIKRGDKEAQKQIVYYYNEIENKLREIGRLEADNAKNTQETISQKDQYHRNLSRIKTLNDEISQSELAIADAEGISLEREERIAKIKSENARITNESAHASFISNNESNATEENYKAVASYEKLISSAKEYYNLLMLESSGTITATQRQRLDELKTAWHEATIGIGEYTTFANGLPASIDKVTAAQKRFLTTAAQSSEIDISEKLKKYQTQFSSMLKNGRWTEKYAQQLRNVINWINKINSNPIDLNSDKERNELTQLIKTCDDLAGSKGLGKVKAAADASLEKMREKIERIMADNTAMGGELRDKFNNLKLEIKTGKSVEDVSRISAKVAQLSAELDRAGQRGKSFGDTIRQRLTGVNAQLVAQLLSWQDIVRYIRTAGQTVRELNTAYTEMLKVSDESAASLKAYQAGTFDIANEVGTTALALTNSTADWMRLGENLTTAAESARDATILLNVSEFESINDATKALVSASQAYNELDKMEIIDVLNNVGNNFSISTDQLAQGLQNAAAVLKTQGNDLYEAVALLTAGNAITQDISKASAGMRTIALRLAGTEEAKNELVDLGEDVDDFIVATKSKMQDLIKDYTAVASNAYKGVDILDANGNLKDTYTILLEISKVYQEILETDKIAGTNRGQALVEAIAGKNRANIASSILLNPELLENVYNKAQNSENSAQQELEKYLNSVDGAIARFNNALQQFQYNLLDADTVSNVIDFGTKVINMIDDITEKLGGLPGVIGAISGALISIKDIGFFTGANGKFGLNNSGLGAFINAPIDAIGNRVELNKAMKTYGSQFQSVINSFAKSSNYERSMLDKTFINADNFRNAASIKDTLDELILKEKELGHTGELSAEQIKTAFTGAGKSLSGLKAVASAVGATLLNIGVSLAITLAINAAIKAWDNYVHALDHAKEKYEENETQLESLNSQLETTNTRIDELQNKESLTFVEEQELEKLRETNRQLELEIENRKQLSEINKSKLQKENAKAFNRRYGRFDETGNNRNRKVNPQSGRYAGDELSYLIDQRNIAQEKYNKAISHGKDKVAQGAQNTIDSYNSRIEEEIQKLLDYRKTALEVGDDVTREAIDVQLKFAYKNTNQENVWNNQIFDSIFDTDGLEKTKDEFIELARTGQLNIDEFPKLKAAWEAADFIGAGHDVEELTERLKALWLQTEAGQHYISGRDRFEDILPSYDENGFRSGTSTEFNSWYDQQNISDYALIDTIGFSQMYQTVRNEMGLTADAADVLTEALNRYKNVQTEVQKQPTDFTNQDFSENLTQKLAKVQTAYSSFFESVEKGSEKAFDLDTLEGLRQDLVQGVVNGETDIKNAVGVTAEQFKKFEDVVGNSNSTLEEQKEAWDELSTALANAYWDSATDGLSKIDDGTKQLIKDQLILKGYTKESVDAFVDFKSIEAQISSEELPILNFKVGISDESITETQTKITYVRGMLEAELANGGDTSALQAELDALLDTQKLQIWAQTFSQLIGESKNSLVEYTAQLIAANDIDLNNDASVTQLQKLMSSSGLTANAISKLIELMEIYNKIASGYYDNNGAYLEGAKARAKQLLTEIEAINSQPLKLDTKKVENSLKNTGTAAGKAADKMSDLSSELNKLESDYKALQEMVDTYNETGGITLEQAEKLADMDFKVLSALSFDEETGAARLDNSAMQDLTKSKISYLKVQMALRAYDLISTFTSETAAIEYLNSAIRQGTADAANYLAILEKANGLKLGYYGSQAREEVEDALLNGFKLLDNITFEVEGGGEGGEGGGGGGGAAGGDDEAAKEAAAYKEKLEKDIEREYFDWIEIKLDKLDKDVQKWVDSVDRLFSFWNKNWAINKSIQAGRTQIAAQESAFQYYLKFAQDAAADAGRYVKDYNDEGEYDLEKIQIVGVDGLSKAYQKLFETGKMAVEKFNGHQYDPLDPEHSSYGGTKTLYEKLQAYQEWFDKAIAAQEKITELYQQERDLIKSKLNNVIEYFDTLDSYFDSVVSKLDSAMSVKEASGQRKSISDLLQTYSADFESMLNAEEKQWEYRTGISKKHTRSSEEVLADINTVNYSDTDLYKNVAQQQQDILAQQEAYNDKQAEIADLKQQIKEETDKAYKKELQAELKVLKKEAKNLKLTKAQTDTLNNMNKEMEAFDSIYSASEYYDAIKDETDALRERQDTYDDLQQQIADKRVEISEAASTAEKKELRKELKELQAEAKKVKLNKKQSKNLTAYEGQIGAMADAGNYGMTQNVSNAIAQRDALRQRKQTYQELTEYIAELNQAIKEETDKAYKKELQTELKQVKKEAKKAKLSSNDEKILKALENQVDTIQDIQTQAVVDNATASTAMYQELVKKIGNLQQKTTLSASQQTTLALYLDELNAINAGIASDKLKEYISIYEKWFAQKEPPCLVIVM